MGARKEIRRGRWAGQSGGDKEKKDAAQISFPFDAVALEDGSVQDEN